MSQVKRRRETTRAGRESAAARRERCCGGLLSALGFLSWAGKLLTHPVAGGWLWHESVNPPLVLNDHVAGLTVHGRQMP